MSKGINQGRAFSGVSMLLLAILFATFVVPSVAGDLSGKGTGAAELADKQRAETAKDLELLVKKQRTRRGWLGDGSLPQSVKALKDVPYVESVASPSQKLDLYLPQSKQPLPLVIWIHGGGWRSGDKKGGPIRQLVEAGFAVASINYRLSQEAKWPAQLDDCKAATAFLLSHAGDYGIDGNRVGIWGASAGGHLALLLALNPPSDSPHSIKAVCDWFGPCDLKSYLNQKDSNAMGVDMVRDLLGKDSDDIDARSWKASPMSNIKNAGKMPDLLILHGKRDRLVPVEQSENFVEALKVAGHKNVKLIVTGGGHGFPGFGPQNLKESLEFFKSRLEQASRISP